MQSKVGLRKHHINKASGGDGIPVELFQILYERCTIKKVTAENWMLLNCGVGEDACRSLRLQGDATTPS